MSLAIAIAAAPVACGAAALPFFDDFSGPNGQTDPDWNVIAGSWIVQNGKYLSTPAESWKYSIVKDLSFEYGYASVECTYGNGGLIARWKDAQHFLFVNLYARGLLLIRPESEGGWQFVWGTWHGNGGRDPQDGDRMRCQAWIERGRVRCRIDDLDTGGYAEESIDFNCTGWNEVGCFSYTVSEWDNFQARDVDRGNLEGYVTDARTGLGVVGATVELTDMPYSATTGSDGYYLLSNVPAGNAVMLKASAPSYFPKEVSTTPQANQTTRVDLALDKPTALPFLDTFSGPGHVEGQPDPDFDVIVGAWVVQEGYYVPSAGTGPWPLSMVKNLTMTVGVVSVEGFPLNSGVVARYKDASNLLILHPYGMWVMLNAGIISNPGTSSGWIGGPAPAATDRVLMRATAIGDEVYGYLEVMSTGAHMDLSVPLPDPTWTRVGLFSWDAGQRWDNFRAYIPQPISMSIASAKASGPRSYVKIQGIVTAAFSDIDCFYVESEDRSSAIKVFPLPSPAPEAGTEVVVVGSTVGDGTLSQDAVSATGRQVDLGPLGMDNRDITGAVGNPGLSNMDLLVTTWGRLLCDPVVYPDGSRRIYISDRASTASLPTALVYDPTNSESVFEDDFEAGKKAEWRPASGAGTTSVASGKLVNDVASSTNLEIVQGINLRDVKVKAHVQKGESCGLIARYTDENHRIIGWYRNNKIEVREYNPEFRQVCPIQDTPLLSGTVLLSLKVVGSDVTFSATDGVTDYATIGTIGTRIEPGTVGLCRDASSQWTHFDNFNARRIGRTASSDAVEIIVLPSIQGIPPVREGNVVTATGIAARDHAMDGTPLRTVMVRPNGITNLPWLRVDVQDSLGAFPVVASRYAGQTRARLGRPGAVWYYGHMDEVVRNPDGTLTCKWDKIDPGIDAMVPYAQDLVVPFAYMPNAIVDAARRTAFGLSIGLNCAPPLDYSEWEDICYQAVRHFNIDRGLNLRYWEVWNEPNATGFWPGSFDEYLMLYASAASGCRRADVNAKVGGPTVTVGGPLSTERPEIGEMPMPQLHEFNPPPGWTPGAVPQYTNYSKDSPFELIAKFIDHCHRNGLPMDFLVWHNYNDAPDLDVHDLESFGANARLFRSWLNRYPGFSSAEMMVDEWGILSPTDAMTDTIFHCGAAVEMARNGVLCNYPAFTTAESANAMTIFSMLGPDRVRESASAGLYAIATRLGSVERLDVLVVRLDKEANAQPLRVKVELRGLPLRSSFRWRRYVLDPEHPELLSRRADLLVPVEDVLLPGGASIERDVTLAPRSVNLIRVW